jgi:hypothetical protein
MHHHSAHRGMIGSIVLRPWRFEAELVGSE